MVPLAQTVQLVQWHQLIPQLQQLQVLQPVQLVHLHQSLLEFLSDQQDLVALYLRKVQAALVVRVGQLNLVHQWVLRAQQILLVQQDQWILWYHQAPWDLLLQGVLLALLVPGDQYLRALLLDLEDLCFL